MWHQLRHTYASTLAAGGGEAPRGRAALGSPLDGDDQHLHACFREAYEDFERVLEEVYGGWLRGCERPGHCERQR